MSKKSKFTIVLFLAILIWSVPIFALELGEQIPDYQLQDLEGNEVHISDFDGEYVLFDVWATWADYCLETFENYKANMDQFEKAGIKIVVINTDAQLETLMTYLEENPLPFTILHDEYNTASRRWGVRGYPTTILVNPEGKMIKQTLGLKPFDVYMMQLKETIQVDKEPLPRVKELKTEAYKMNVVDLDYPKIREKYDRAPLNFDSRSVVPKPQFEHIKDPEIEGTPLYGYIPFFFDKQLFSFIGIDTDGDKAADQLFVDENMNLDFTDDKEAEAPKKEKDRTGKLVNIWKLSVPVKVHEEVVVEYQVTTYFSKLWSAYYVFPKQGFETMIQSDLGEIKALLIDTNANGILDDETDLIFIDLNGNSSFDSYSGQEWFMLKDEIKLYEKYYQIKITQNNKEILLELAK